MEPQELKIEMPAEDLADFRNYLLEHGGDELEPQELHEVSAGFQREPILIALVVALGGPVITVKFVSLAKEWLRIRGERAALEQQERIKQAELKHQERIKQAELEQQERIKQAELEHQERLKHEEDLMKLSLLASGGRSHRIRLDELERP